MITDIKTTTPTGLCYELEGSECEGVTVLHYYVRGIHLGERALPEMDAWLLVVDGDGETVLTVVLWPKDNRWPIHALSCGNTAQGDGIETASSAALDEYAVRQADTPYGVWHP